MMTKETVAEESAPLEAKGNPRVFVYGSLKRGHSNHLLLEEYNFLGRAYIEGPWRMMGLGFFPGVTEGHDEDSRIYGEVYVVDEEGLASLDVLEGHPHFYERKKVRTNESEFGNVWCYFLKSEHDDTREVHGGLWYPDAEEQEYWDGAESNAA